MEFVQAGFIMVDHFPKHNRAIELSPSFPLLRLPIIQLIHLPIPTSTRLWIASPTMFTPTTTPPKFVTPEEHAQITSSTPESFFDIPPALRFHNTEVEVQVDPTPDFLPSGNVKGTIWVTEEYVFGNIVLKWGTLLTCYDTSRVFVFIPSAGTANGTKAPVPTGFSLKYPSITLHAISPASDSTPAYLYCQVEDPSAKVQNTAETDGDDAEVEGDDEEFVPMRELKVFVKTPEQRKYRLRLHAVHGLI